MDTAAIIISIVALFAAGAAIYFQYVVSRDTRDHLGRFESEAHLLLGEIRGHTTETRDKLLDVAVARTREATESQTDGLHERIDAIEKALREEREPSEEVRDDFRELRSTVNAMRHGIPSAVQQATRDVRQPSIRMLIVDRPPSSLGEKASIVLGWWGRFESPVKTLWAVCRVMDPQGRLFEARQPAGVSRGSGAAAGTKIEHFNYPDDFDGGDTKAPGRYQVIGQVIGISDRDATRDMYDVRLTTFDLAERAPEPDDSTRI